jgi:chromosome partitioning protein
MTHTIAFSHFKGGTGKTTSCLSVAGFLAMHGARVLAVDLDPQANLTTGLGVHIKKARKTMHQVMRGTAKIQDAIVKSPISNIHLAPANYNLAHTHYTKYSAKKEAFALKNALKDVKKHYDYVVVDLPPSNHYFIANGVLAADSVVLVLDEGHFSLAGIEPFQHSLVPYCRQLGSKIEPRLVIVNKCSKRRGLFKASRGKKIAKHAQQILETTVFTIPHSTYIPDSQEAGLPISHFKPDSKVGRAFMKVAHHLITNQ